LQRTAAKWRHQSKRHSGLEKLDSSLRCLNLRPLLQIPIGKITCLDTWRHLADDAGSFVCNICEFGLKGGLEVYNLHTGCLVFVPGGTAVVVGGAGALRQSGQLVRVVVSDVVGLCENQNIQIKMRSKIILLKELCSFQKVKLWLQNYTAWLLRIQIVIKLFILMLFTNFVSISSRYLIVSQSYTKWQVMTKNELDLCPTT